MTGQRRNRRQFLRDAAVATSALAAGCTTPAGGGRTVRTDADDPGHAATSNITVPGRSEDRHAAPAEADEPPMAPTSEPEPREAMDPESVLRCAMIGVGARGSNLLQALLGQDGVQVVAVADAYDVWRNRALAWCGRRNAAAGYVDYGEMLDAEEVHAVFIATPAHIHAPAVRAALERGMDAYVEPPLALRADEAAALGDLARTKQAVVQMGFQNRSDAMYRHARSVIARGDIGPVISVEVQRHYQDQFLTEFAPPQEANESTIHWDAFLGGTDPVPFDRTRFFRWSRFLAYSNHRMGFLMAPHLDMCHFLTGASMPARVLATGGLYRFRDGRTGNDTYSVMAGYTEGFQFSFTATPAEHRLGIVERVVGTEGSVEIQDMSRMAIYRHDVREDYKSEPVLAHPHLVDFLNAVRSGEQPMAPVAAGVGEAAVEHMATESLAAGTGIAWTAH